MRISKICKLILILVSRLNFYVSELIHVFKLSGVPSYLKSLREKRQKERKWERPATVSSADVFSGQRTDVEAISSATYDEEYYEELDDDDDDGANNDNDEPDSGNDNGYEENNEDEIQGDSNDQPSQSIVLMQSSESHCNVDEYDDEQDEYYDDDDVEEQEKCANSGPQPPFAPSASDQRRLAVAVGTSAVGPLRSSHSESVIAINNNDQADVDRYLAKNPLEFSGNAVSVNVAFSVPKMTQIYLGSGICVNIGTEFEEVCFTRKSHFCLKIFHSGKYNNFKKISFPPAR